MFASPRALRAAAALFAGCILAPSTGFAAKVLVLPYQPMGKGVPQDLAEQATVVITKEMAQGGLTVIQAEDVGDAAPKPAAAKEKKPSDAPTGDPAAGRKAEELVAKAKQAMEDSEFSGAIKSLEKAVKLLEDNGDAVADLRLLPEAYLQLGVAHFRNGNEDQGDDMLNKAVHLDPDRKLDASAYPPIFIRVYERARFNVLRRPRANVEVKAAKGAQVLFDGRNMGKAPIVLKDALPGNHWIRVERPGEPVQVKKVSVKGSRTVVVDFDGGDGEKAETAPAVGVLGAIAQNELTKDHLAQLKGAGARAGADFVMIGGIYKTDTAYMIRTAYVGVKDGAVGRLVDIAFDLDMLSAEVEVYKLAEDARNQAKAGKLSNVAEVTDKFAIAPALRSGSERRPQKQAEETRLTTVVAAPAPPPPPESPTFAEGGSNGGRAPLGGKAPLVAKDEEGEGAKADKPDAKAKADKGEVKAKPETKVVATAPTLVPKDELSPTKKEPSAATASPALVGATAVPKDEEETSEPSTWWIWVVVGVAAAGAAGAGGYLFMSSRSPEEGNLKISW